MITLYKKHKTSIGSWSIIWGDHPDDKSMALLIIGHTKDHINGKVTTSYVGVSGKNIGKSNETTPLQQAELEAKSRAKKQLDKGYVENLSDVSSESTNALGFTMPMTAHPIEKVSKIDWSHAVVQPKLDGHRAMFKEGVLYSRQGKVITLPHITDQIVALGLDHLHLDGEIYVHGLSLQEIGSLIKRPREESLVLSYYIYDVVSEDHYTLRVGSAFARHKGTDMGCLEVLEHHIVTSQEEMMDFHQHMIAMGYEGTMLRHGLTPYESGKRSRSLLKVKNFQDAEFRIVGYREGAPRHVDNRHLPQGVWVLETEDGKSFSATMQGDMWEKNRLLMEGRNHLGRMLTVKFHYYSADGIPQLPVAMRFREDV